jgi:hypothetical protein
MELGAEKSGLLTDQWQNYIETSCSEDKPPQNRNQETFLCYTVVPCQMWRLQNEKILCMPKTVVSGMYNSFFVGLLTSFDYMSFKLWHVL